MRDAAGVNRRDFLLLRVGTRDRATVSCERLYMKYVDAGLAGTTADLMASLEQDLTGVARLSLTDATWLTRNDLRKALEPVLERFRQRGGILDGEPMPGNIE